VEKRGLTSALQAAGISAEMVVTWGDEMRVGLCSLVRRLWAPCGVKVRAVVQWTREWAYLVLAVDGPGGRLYWSWTENMRQESIAAAVQAWKDAGVEAVVWDRAGSHRAHQVRAVGVRTVEQPAGAPEVNPAERVFEELRRGIEGRVYATLAEKKAAVEVRVNELAAAPERIRQLAGWEWIRAARAALPTAPPAPPVQNTT
jgi:hypothetical protein